MRVTYYRVSYRLPGCREWFKSHMFDVLWRKRDAIRRAKKIAGELRVTRHTKQSTVVYHAKPN